MMGLSRPYPIANKCLCFGTMQCIVNKGVKYSNTFKAHRYAPTKTSKMRGFKVYPLIMWFTCLGCVFYAQTKWLWCQVASSIYQSSIHNTSITLYFIYTCKDSHFLSHCAAWSELSSCSFKTRHETAHLPEHKTVRGSKTHPCRKPEIPRLLNRLFTLKSRATYNFDFFMCPTSVVLIYLTTVRHLIQRKTDFYWGKYP